MKTDFPVKPPADIQPGWEGQFQIFSWYNFVVNIPSAIYIITTRKENGLPNASLNAWGMLLGSGEEPKFALQVSNGSDTLRLIEAKEEFVVNFPSMDLREQCQKTTTHYPDEVDEITASGLTPGACTFIDAPAVKECYARLECTLDWIRPLEVKIPINNLVMGSVVHAAVEEDALLPDVKSAFTRRAIPYHFGEFYNHAEKRCGAGEHSGFCEVDVEGFVPWED